MYKNTGRQHEQIMLWGAPASLWTGRVRAYLIKKGINYQEIRPAEARYHHEILPLLGYFAVPATEMEDGTLIQDGTDTMEYLEARYPERPMIPITPVQKALAWLIECFGSDLFFIPAMHYRWNFPEQQDYIRAEFARSISVHTDPEKQLADIAPVGEFFKDFPRQMGITPDTIPAIEASHIECLRALNAHFAHYPYVLGGHPSIADFGLIGPLYAHLGRDPVPANLMKKVSPHVFRWTERMFESNKLDFAFTSMPYEFPAGDRMPETLMPFLKYMLRDCAPQLQGMIDTFNDWAERNPSLPSGAPVQTDPQAPPGAHPQLGAFDFELRGVTVHSQAYSNVVYHFQRVLDVVESLDSAGRQKFDTLMLEVGGTELISSQLTRRIKSENYQFLLA
ncbi:MAG: glutathione S-transferase family protein [Gammaproteobacteria bacterium]